VVGAPGAAVWLWIRRDARRRVRSLVVLGVLVAVAGAVVLAVTAGARRNRSVVDRALAITLPADLLVLPNHPGVDWDAVRAFPEVETVGEFPVVLLTIDGVPPSGEPIGFPPASPEAGVSIERPVLSDGRRLDQSRVDEVVLGPEIGGFHVGDHLTVRLYTAAEIDAVLAGAAPLPDAPGGPAQDVTVVGRVKDSFFGEGIQVTQAFVQRYAADLVGPTAYVNAVVRLRHGAADSPAFQAHLNALVGQPVEVQNERDTIKTQTNATSLESSSLYAFAAAAGAASVVLVGMAMLRTIVVSAGDLPMLRALGFTRRQQVLALVAAPFAAALAGGVDAVPLAWAASSRFPIGLGRELEPTPGHRFDGLVLGLGFVALVALVAAGCSWLGWRQLSRSLTSVGPARTSRFGGAIARAGVPVPMALGTRLALERGRGASAVPVRPALVGAVVGVLGLVGALTFRDGLSRAVDDRALFGQPFDGQIELPTSDVERFDDAALAPVLADPDVAAVQDVRNAVLVMGDRSVSVFGIRDLDGTIPVRPVAGRLPVAPDEIALAPVELDGLGLHVGDTVRVGPEQVPLHVVGEVFSPSLSHTQYDQGARMTDEGLRRFAPSDSELKFHNVVLRYRAGADADAVAQRLDGALSGLVVVPITPVEDQANLGRVRNVPAWLGGFLALLATAAVGHALASAVRRRRRDVAVLRVLGLTRRQARASVAWQATTLAVVGVAFGIPLGLLAGRTIWREVARATPMLYVAPAAVLAAVLAVPAALALANALAAWPGRTAARTRPAEVLRVE
jgi:hypothetical protein